MTMDEWYEERVVKPKQEWARVSKEAKWRKLQNRISKRDIDRELRIEALGGKPIEVTYGIPLSEEQRKQRLELEWDLKYPNRKEKKSVRKKAKKKAKGKSRTQQDFISGVLKGIKTRAAKKGIPCDLEESDIKIPKVCPVLGIPLKWGDSLLDSTPSIDRLVPELGYVKGNCFVISMKANRLKSNASVEEFKALIAYMEGNLLIAP